MSRAAAIFLSATVLLTACASTRVRDDAATRALTAATEAAALFVDTANTRSEITHRIGSRYARVEMLIFGSEGVSEARITLTLVNDRLVFFSAKGLLVSACAPDAGANEAAAVTYLERWSGLRLKARRGENRDSYRLDFDGPTEVIPAPAILTRCGGRLQLFGRPQEW
jgi:hypothetical protein